MKVKSIDIREAVRPPLPASDQTIERSRSSLTDQLSNGFIGGAHPKRDPKVLKVPQRVPGDSYRSVRSAHDLPHAGTQHYRSRARGM
jgi:hypothetical protein